MLSILTQKGRVYEIIRNLSIPEPTMCIPINEEDKNNNRLIWNFKEPKGTLYLDLVEPDANIMWMENNGGTSIHTLHNDDEIEVYLMKYFLNHNFN